MEPSIRVDNSISEDLFFTGDSYFSALIHDIKQAMVSIDLSTYIFVLDNIGVSVATALMNAAYRGVRVRLLVDGIGSAAFSRKWIKKLSVAGVEFKIYNPYPWSIHIRNWALTRLSHRPFIFNLLLNINKRNHCKMCVIDDNIVWIGSFNITAVHLSITQGGKGWRDTAIRIVNHPELSVLQELINRKIYKSFQEKLPRIKLLLFRFGFNFMTKRKLYINLLKRINHAQHHILITNAYFVPDPLFFDMLKRKAKQGIIIKILLPAKTDVRFIRWVATCYYRELIDSGVQIYEYTKSMLHSKSLIIDDWYIVGSSNMNRRSIFHDIELDAVVNTPLAKSQLLQQFYADLDCSQPITLPLGKIVPVWQQMFGQLLLILRYWF